MPCPWGHAGILEVTDTYISRPSRPRVTPGIGQRYIFSARPPVNASQRAMASEQKCSSSSMPKLIRPVRSAATSVDPEPKKRASTAAPVLEEFSRARSIRVWGAKTRSGRESGGGSRAAIASAGR